MQNDHFAEHKKARVKAAQLAHGIKYQGVFFLLSGVAWVVLIIMIADRNG